MRYYLTNPLHPIHINPIYADLNDLGSEFRLVGHFSPSIRKVFVQDLQSLHI